MANSVTFNGTDLADFGLIVNNWHPSLDFEREAGSIQLFTKAIAGKAIYPPKDIRLAITVEAASTAALITAMDNLKARLNVEGSYQLILDQLSTRYWTVRFVSITGRLISPATFGGTLTFTADDPAAYSMTNTSSNFNIDAGPAVPTTVEEDVGGNAYVEPIYTLKAGENLVGVTIKLENLTTDEEIQWTGSLSINKRLEINCVTWVVRKENGSFAVDMASVTGQFPRLKAGVTNQIKVSAFSDTGTLNIAYRDKYV